MTAFDSPAPAVCAACGADLPRSARACPECHTLVHRDRLQAIARDAHSSTPEAAAVLWREALDLLPPGSKQAEQVRGRLERAVAAMQAAPAERPAEDQPAKPAGKGPPKWLAGLGAGGLLLWKFKFVLVFLATKAKFLLFGVTKWQTALSMLVALWAYWLVFGWWFALGFVLIIYVHEMGHVAALRRYGIPADPPMFIPGLGAFVAMKAYPKSPIEDARVGLAGPAFGLGAAAFTGAIFLATGSPLFAALTRIGGFINLFNLIPIWQLDGGRAYASLSRSQRWWATGFIAAALLLTGEGILWLLLFGSIYRAWTAPKEDPEERDDLGFWYYVALVWLFAWIAVMNVPGMESLAS